MPINARLALASILLALSGCTPSVAVRPTAPLIVTQTHYIGLPFYLIQGCDTSDPVITTWGSLAQGYITVRAQRDACASQVSAIALLDH